MKILLSPVVPTVEKTIKYSFEQEKITAKKNDIVEKYDFNDLPNGRMESIDSALDVIQSAERIDGVLWVKLKNYIQADATHEERFPEWQEYERLSDEKINGDGEVAKIEWKTQEQIDVEIAEADELRRIQEMTPDPEERIEMLENMLLGLMLQL